MYTESQVRKVLTSAGIRIVHEGSSDFSVFCPFHTNNRTPAGEVNYESGLFYCFSCKHYALLEDFVVKASGITYFQALRLIDKHKDTSSIVEQVFSALDPTEDQPSIDPEEIERLHEQMMQSDRALGYLHRRGILTESIVQHKFGYSQKQDMVTFPFLTPNGSRYLGFEGRSVEGKRFLTNGNKSNTLFNLNNRMWSDSVFLTESVLDCVRLEQCGAPAVASMSANRSKAQINLLGRHFNNVYVVQDNDPASNGFAGQVAAKKLVDKLADRGIIVVPPEGYKDIGDMPDEEIKLLVAQTTDITKGI